MLSTYLRLARLLCPIISLVFLVHTQSLCAEPTKEELVEQLVSKGDAAVQKGDQQSAYWAYRFASVYTPENGDIAKKMAALGEPDLLVSNAELKQMGPALEVFPSIAIAGFRDSRDAGDRDVIELQILLDSKLVGDLRASETTDSQNGITAQVFRRKPQMTHKELAKKYGRAFPVSAGLDGNIYVLRYGRIRIVEKDDKVIGVFYPHFEDK